MFSTTTCIAGLSCCDQLKLHVSYCSLSTSYLDSEAKFNTPSIKLTFCSTPTSSASLSHPRAHWCSTALPFLLSGTSFLEWCGIKSLGSPLILVLCSILYCRLPSPPQGLLTPQKDSKGSGKLSLVAVGLYYKKMQIKTRKGKGVWNKVQEKLAQVSKSSFPGDLNRWIQFSKAQATICQW